MLTSTFSVELPGIEPAALPGLLLPELPVRSVSFRFSASRYLQIPVRVLTASRAVTYRRELPASYVPGGRVIMKRSGSSKRRGSRLAAAKLAPRGSTQPSPAGDHACLFLFHQLRRKHVSHERCRGVPPRFIGLLDDAATVRGK